MKNNPAKNIFISYRVQDTAGETGRLVDALKQRFADEQIFMDIHNLEPGADFTEAIEGSLDTCDVFLAVIGPYWLGHRDGKDVRINDMNDWVRMEVSTALRRNIRVVPVLVDGATLPKPEQLPPELQPLLRRQALEISNSRWRYDTDRLIDFLIQTAGIPPLKGKTAEPVAEHKKPRTLLYTGIGFGLAVALFLVVLFLLPKGKGEAYRFEKEQSTAGKVLNTTDADPVYNEKESGTDASNGKDATAEDVTGRWVEEDEGIKSTFIFKQSGTKLDVKVQAMGQVLSTGTGEIKNGKVELKFELLGSPTVLKAAVSKDGKRMSGTYTMEATGEPQKVTLVRSENK